MASMPFVDQKQELSQGSEKWSEAWKCSLSELELPAQPPSGSSGSESTDFDGSSQSLVSEESKISGKKKLKACGSWKLVWHSKKCFTEENTPLRKSLSEVARKLDSTLICVKAPSRLQKWLFERSKRKMQSSDVIGSSDLGLAVGLHPNPISDHVEMFEPYVLMTDQINASSCAEIMAMQAQQNCPAMTVLMCNSCDGIEAARAWVQEKAPPQMHPVLMCTSIESPTKFFSTLLARLADKTAPLPSNFAEASIPEQLQPAPSCEARLCYVHSVGLSSQFGCKAIGHISGVSQVSMGASCGSASRYYTVPPALVGMGSDNDTFSNQWHMSPSLCSIMLMLGCASVENLAELLKGAQPERYED